MTCERAFTPSETSVRLISGRASSLRQHRSWGDGEWRPGARRVGDGSSSMPKMPPRASSAIVLRPETSQGVSYGGGSQVPMTIIVEAAGKGSRVTVTFRTGGAQMVKEETIRTKLCSYLASAVSP
jgi:hypothetical protein